MDRVRRLRRNKQRHERSGRLPLRWAFILLTAGLGAAGAGSVGGPVAAITAGIAVLATLPKVVA